MNRVAPAFKTSIAGWSSLHIVPLGPWALSLERFPRCGVVLQSSASFEFGSLPSALRVFSSSALFPHVTVLSCLCFSSAQTVEACMAMWAACTDVPLCAHWYEQHCLKLVWDKLSELHGTKSVSDVHGHKRNAESQVRLFQTARSLSFDQ